MDYEYTKSFSKTAGHCCFWQIIGGNTVFCFGAFSEYMSGVLVNFWDRLKKRGGFVDIKNKDIKKISTELSLKATVWNFNI